MTLGACCVYIYSQVDDCIRLRVFKCAACVGLFVIVVVLGIKPPKGISKDTYSNIAPFPVVSVLQRYATPPFLWEIGVIVVVVKQQGHNGGESSGLYTSDNCEMIMNHTLLFIVCLRCRFGSFHWNPIHRHRIESGAVLASRIGDQGSANPMGISIQSIG